MTRAAAPSSNLPKKLRKVPTGMSAALPRKSLLLPHPHQPFPFVFQFPSSIQPIDASRSPNRWRKNGCCWVLRLFCHVVLLSSSAGIARSLDPGCWMGVRCRVRILEEGLDLISTLGYGDHPLQGHTQASTRQASLPSQITRVEPACVDLGIVINKCYLMPTRAWGPPPFNVRPCKPGPATPSERRKCLDSASSNYMYRKDVK